MLNPHLQSPADYLVDPSAAFPQMSGRTVEMREKKIFLVNLSDQIQGQIYVTYYYSMDSGTVDPRLIYGLFVYTATSLLWPVSVNLLRTKPQRETLSYLKILF